MSYKSLTNEKLKYLKNIEFKELKVLNLSYNYISDIKVLENVNFKELKELHLSYNEISDIKVLENVNFKELKKLDLGYNKINAEENSSIIKNLKLKFKIQI